MTETSAESSASNLPLIEKITNIKSMLMIFVVLLMTDISLVLLFEKNLFTYVWQDMKIHYGKAATIGAGWLFFYVVVAPLISGFMVWLLLWIHKQNTAMMDALFKDENSTTEPKLHQEKSIKAELLKLWAIKNNDTMALGLAQARIQQHASAQEENRKLHMAISAFILLMVWSFFMPGTLSGDFMVQTIDAVSRFRIDLIFACLLGSICILASLIIWWSSRYLDIHDDSTKVWYPKATEKTPSRP